MWLSLPPELLRFRVLIFFKLRDLVLFGEALQASTQCKHLLPILLSSLAVSQRVRVSDANGYWFTKYNMKLLNIEVHSISREHIAAIFKYAQMVDVSQYNWFDTQKIISIISACDCLESFTAADYPDDPFIITEKVGQALIDHCPGIISLSFSDCSCIGADMFVKLSAAYPNLRSLSLSAARFPIMGTDTFSLMLQNFPHLQEVSLHTSPTLTDESVSVIAMHCTKLTALSLRWMFALTDQSMQDLFAALPNLTHVDLTYSWSLSDAAIEAMAGFCPKLESVVLVGLSLSDYAVKELACRCPKLRILDLREAENVTHEGVCAIADHCSNLVELMLRENMITNTSTSYLLQHCKQLHCVHISP